MESIRHLQRRYCGGALTVAVVLSAGCCLAGWPAMTRGLIIGSLFSALNFALLGKTMMRKLTAPRRGGGLITLVAQLGRYLLWAVPVVIAVKLPPVDLPATIAGLFMVPICIVTDSVFSVVRGRKSPLF
ncbi:MAG: ATP synthase subunit I [Deltaproteobacteria bacterium]|nr:ATP synthase subunit I [Deltaproteobacteria bacterium]